MNNCNFVGRMTRDPELRTTSSGKEVTDFSVAINEGKDRDPTYVDVTAFGQQATLVCDFFKKGDPIALTARARNERWEKDGEKRSKLSFILDRLTFVGGGKKDGKPNDEPAAESKPKDSGDDIPF